VREPFIINLCSHFELIKRWQQPNINLDRENLSAADEDALLAFAFERYFNTSSLCGNSNICRRMIETSHGHRCHEVAC
jgi:hypothetical protein